MALSIPHLKDLFSSTSEIKFDPPISLSNGGRLIKFPTPHLFKVPSLVTPFGLSSWEGKKYSIDLSLNPENPDAVALKKAMEDFENVLIEKGFNDRTWLKQKFKSAESVAELFASPIKYPKIKDPVTGAINVNEKYAPTLKIQVPYSEKHGFECDAYDHNKKCMVISDKTVPQGSTISAIVQITGIWIAGNKFGPTLKVVQMKVQPNPNQRLEGCAFVDDSDDDVEPEVQV